MKGIISRIVDVGGVGIRRRLEATSHILRLPVYRHFRVDHFKISFRSFGDSVSHFFYINLYIDADLTPV